MWNAVLEGTLGAQVGWLQARILHNTDQHNPRPRNKERYTDNTDNKDNTGNNVE